MLFVCTVMTMDANITVESILPDMNTHNTNKTHTHKQKFLVENVLGSTHLGLVFFICFFFPFLLPQSHSYIVVTMETEWSAPREGLREQQMQYGWECSMLDCGREIEQWVTNSISPLPTALWSSTSRGIIVSHHSLIMGIFCCLEVLHWADPYPIPWNNWTSELLLYMPKDFAFISLSFFPKLLAVGLNIPWLYLNFSYLTGYSFFWGLKCDLVGKRPSLYHKP